MFAKSEVIHKRFARLVQIHHAREENRCKTRLLGFVGLRRSFCSLGELSGSPAEAVSTPQMLNVHWATGLARPVCEEHVPNQRTPRACCLWTGVAGKCLERVLTTPDCCWAELEATSAQQRKERLEDWRGLGGGGREDILPSFGILTIAETDVWDLVVRKRKRLHWSSFLCPCPCLCSRGLYRNI